MQSFGWMDNIHVAKNAKQTDHCPHLNNVHILFLWFEMNLHHKTSEKSRLIAWGELRTCWDENNVEVFSKRINQPMQKNCIQRQKWMILNELFLFCSGKLNSFVYFLVYFSVFLLVFYLTNRDYQSFLFSIIFSDILPKISGNHPKVFTKKYLHEIRVKYREITLKCFPNWTIRKSSIP